MPQFTRPPQEQSSRSDNYPALPYDLHKRQVDEHSGVGYPSEIYAE